MKNHGNSSKNISQFMPNEQKNAVIRWMLYILYRILISLLDWSHNLDVNLKYVAHILLYIVVSLFCLKLKISETTSPNWLYILGKPFKYLEVVSGYFLDITALLYRLGAKQTLFYSLLYCRLKSLKLYVDTNRV